MAEGPNAIRLPSGDHEGPAAPTEAPAPRPVTCRRLPSGSTTKISVSGLSAFGAATSARPVATWSPPGSVGSLDGDVDGIDEADADALALADGVASLGAAAVQATANRAMRATTNGPPNC